MKKWFITGASRGFGKEFAKAALERGDHVAATARDIHDLDDLVAAHGAALTPIVLDVTDRGAVLQAVDAAQHALGTIDIVVNNAGYGLFGTVEEITEDQLRAQLEVNLFGVFHVTQAVLPIPRKQGHGHIVQISTVGGVAAFPNLGGYHASKWALEGMSESLAQEVAHFGIKVTLVEPGGFSTDWNGASSVRAEPMPEYDFLREAAAERRKTSPPNMGDPTAVGAALLKVVDADEPPLRVFFGATPPVLVPQPYQARLETWEQWNDVALEAHGG